MEKVPRSWTATLYYKSSCGFTLSYVFKQLVWYIYLYLLHVKPLLKPAIITTGDYYVIPNVEKRFNLNKS